MKKMADVKVSKGFSIILPESVVNHLNLIEGEDLKVLFTEEAIILMRPEVFGEKILKN